MKWNENIQGIHIIQHFNLKSGIEDVGEILSKIIHELENPVLAIVNLKSNAKMTYSHEVNKTKNPESSMLHYINNSLKKYPQTERIILEGGENIILFSSKPFE